MSQFYRNFMERLLEAGWRDLDFAFIETDPDGVEQARKLLFAHREQMAYDLYAYLPRDQRLFAARSFADYMKRQPEEAVQAYVNDPLYDRLIQGGWRDQQFAEIGDTPEGLDRAIRLLSNLRLQTSAKRFANLPKEQCDQIAKFFDELAGLFTVQLQAQS